MGIDTMENAAPSRLHQRSATITRSVDSLAELIRSAWKSLRSTPPMVSMRQPMRLGPATKRIASMPKSARSLPARLFFPTAAELVDLARRHECPQCHGIKFRGSRPRNVEWVLCLACVFPYRCYSCNRRFFGLCLERDPTGHRRETDTSLWYTH